MLKTAPSPTELPQANEPCWCGSGRKYKRCHKPTEGRVLQGDITPMRSVPASIPRPQYADSGVVDRWAESRVKTPATIERMRHAGIVAAEVLRLTGARVAPGVTTEELDEFCHQLCIERGVYPSPLNYNGYPKSLCTSVNEVICHGIPDSRALVEGDIVNLDVTVFTGGVHGDTNATFAVGEVDAYAGDDVVEEAAALRPRSQQQQDLVGGRIVEEVMGQGSRAGIHPVDVLDHDDQGTHRCEAGQPRRKGFVQSPSVRFRLEVLDCRQAIRRW